MGMIVSGIIHKVLLPIPLTTIPLTIPQLSSSHWLRPATLRSISPICGLADATEPEQDWNHGVSIAIRASLE